VGGLLGLLNGVLIAYGRVHAIIITFGTANIFLWISLKIFNSTTVNNIPDTLAPLGNGAAGRTFGIPNSFLITVVLAAIAWFYLRHTAGGRHFFAIGGDQLAAQLAGVKVQQRILAAYLLTGLLVGLASTFVVAQGSNLGQNVGNGKELAVIAAVVIGGTSITGGRGSVLGTVLGALLVQTVASGVTQLGWRSELSDLFVGVAIIIAVGADLIRERARTKR
jgi:ribose transport system permease protein